MTIKALKTLVGATALALTFGVTAANAATYNFNWSANPGIDPTIAASGDFSLTAVGTFDINVAFGSNFSNADISNVSIFVSGNSVDDFTASASIGTNGSISSQGQVSFFDFNLGTVPSNSNFSCFTDDCGGGFLIATGPGGGAFTSYGNSTAALAALNSATSLAVSAVPLPAGGLLLISGLAGIAGLNRRKKNTA